MGLEVGDVITDINGETITSWNDLSLVMKQNQTVHLSISYRRDGQTFTDPLVTVGVLIQTAGLSNVKEDGTIYSTETIIGRATGRASSGDGLEAGDLITHIEQDGVKVPVNHWDDIISYFKTHTSGTVTITYLDQEDQIAKTFTYDLISENALSKLGYQSIMFQIGISPTSSFDSFVAPAGFFPRK